MPSNSRSLAVGAARSVSGEPDARAVAVTGATATAGSAAVTGAAAVAASQPASASTNAAIDEASRKSAATKARGGIAVDTAAAWPEPRPPTFAGDDKRLSDRDNRAAMEPLTIAATNVRPAYEV